MKAALKLIPEKVKELLESSSKELERAWANVGDKVLKIAIPLEIGFDKYGKPICKVGISFVMEKFEDSRSFNWDDKQLPLLPKADVDKDGNLPDADKGNTFYNKKAGKKDGL